MPGENVTTRPAAPNSGRLAIVQNAETIARLYRRLVLVVGLQLLAAFGRLPLIALAPQSLALPILGLVLLVALACALALAVTAYKLSEEMGLGVPLLWAIAMFFPCINILTLLVMSSKAQAWCRQYGIKVGLLGPTPESIEDLRRRMMTSQFD
jgi:hypothetical protein